MRSAVLRRAAVPALIAATLLTAAAPAAVASAAPGVAAPAPAACTITDASVTWGFKESFRSYISGSIAKGAWEPFGGVGYETPAFTWTGGAGAFDPATGTGSIAFPGGIRFTGHDGLLDTTVQNATLEISPGTGRVLLDLSGVSMEDVLAGDATVATTPQVPLVTLDLSALAVDASGDALSLTATDAATAITAEGYDAFGNYETGTAFDPLTLTASGTCAAPTPTAEETPEAAEPVVTSTPAAAESDDPPGSALPIALFASIGGALVAVIGGTTAAVVATKRKRAGA
ncbi:HtaA domain-containing protein [Microbacterium radiodurans]|uniref:Htaa domain-containing protein n=1 Tax=Microbacterium radiodurans TaxID=661398 RepID=A0A5J5IVU1_9MICO|nr:HtaA domain-containing protein [Microbacterium radiodurans]KAA9089376.1 hypothetical protein F6B42_02500 [Microbacterium radiodurans]